MHQSELHECLDYLFSKNYNRFSIIDAEKYSNSDIFQFACQIYKRGIFAQNQKHKISNEFLAPKINFSNETQLIADYFDNEYNFIIVDNFFPSFQTDAFDKNIDFKTDNVFLLDATEQNKTLQTIFTIIQYISNVDQNSKIQRIIGIGGGITLDIAGFVASILQTKLSLIPTTFLSAIDAAIGGKTGVNFEPYGKNQIGSFYFCDEITIASNFFKSLNCEQMLSGLSEGLKHAWLAGNFLENKIIFEHIFDGIINNKIQSNFHQLSLFILDNINTKLKVIKCDPFEYSGTRTALNFGHTIGHVIEILSLKSSKPIQHGIAVAHGMSFVIQNFYEHKMNEINQFLQFLNKIISLFPFEFCEFTQNEFVNILMHDKKNKDSATISMSLPPYGLLNAANWEDFCTTPVSLDRICKGIKF